MKQESDPLSSDELLLRLVLNHPDYVKLDVVVPITFVAFRPRNDEQDGISLYRQEVLESHYGCTADAVPAKFAVEGPNQRGYYVARLRVGMIEQIDRAEFNNLPSLTVTMTPGRLPGHVIIREFTRAWYEANKADGKALAARLAEIASRDIAHRP